MKIVATSDLHGNLPEIPKCDILFIAGDVAPEDWRAPSNFAQTDWQRQWLVGTFSGWLENCPTKHIVGIAGNHDWAFNKRHLYDEFPVLPWNYLHDNLVEINGIKIWGAPYTKTLCGWAFECDPDILWQKWELIPKDVDIIMVHGPAYGFGDKLNRPRPGEDPHSGCTRLLQKIVENHFPNLKVVITGHIHEGYGMVEQHGIKWINPSLMDENFDPTNLPIEFEL